MASLDISLLGTLQLTRDGHAVKERAYAKALALLAWLAVESDRPHQRALLATLFWPDQSDEHARHSLRQALSTLRRVIGGADDMSCLTVTRDAVAFDLDGDASVDVIDYRQLLDACDRHPHARLERCAPCIQRLQRAVALYRGDLLQGFSLPDSIEFDDWVQIWRERLRQQAVDAHAAIATWHEERGALDDASDELRRLLALDPLAEPAHRRLISLLMQAGRRAEGLAQYERLRQILDEELGVEPEPETEALHARLLQTNGQASAAPPARALEPPGYELPAPATRLVGRERELDEIADLLAHRDCRLLTLIGPGGSGKTRLAIEVATEQDRHLPGTACFVSLALVTDPTGILPAITAALGVTLPGNREPERQLLDWLRERSLFIVLDNTEHLVAHLGIVGRMLSAAPGLTMLATSRERLSLSGEWIYELHGLTVPHGEATDGFEGYGAVELLRDRLRQVRPRTPIRHEERPDIIRICQLVEGLPLAIELAAAWAPSLTLGQIAEEIQRNIDFLATATRDLPDRHRSLRAVFNQSWALLDPDEQAAYRRLSLFRGGFSLEAAEAVADATPRHIAALSAKSLITQHLPGRHSLHETLRQYGDELLREHPTEHDELRERHGAYYLGLLASREDALTGRDQHAALAELEQDIENIRAGWQWALDRQRLEEICAACHALWLYMVIRGQMREAASMFGAVLDALGEVPEAVTSDMHLWTLTRARALTRSGGFQSGLGRYDEGVMQMQEGIALLRALEERRELGLALNMLAAAFHLKGEYAQSRALLEESLEHFRMVGDAWGVAFSLNDLGLVSHLLEENTDAERFCVESRSMFRTIGDRRGHAFAAYNLGMIAARGGDHERAKALYRESLSLREYSLDRWGIAASMVQLATELRETGAPAEARETVMEALRIAWDSSVTPVVLDALVELAALQLEAGEIEDAAELLAAIADHPSTPSQVQQRVDALARGAGITPPERRLINASERWVCRAVDDLARALVG